MKEIKSFYVASLLVAIVVFCSCIMGQKIRDFQHTDSGQGGIVTDTDFGLFLATQHALYVNDFTSASKMIAATKNRTDASDQVKSLIDFFNGKTPENVSKLKDSKDLIESLIYDANLIQKDDWKTVYDRHKKDESIISAPLRAFSMAKLGKTKDAIKYIDSLKTNEFWKAFIRGQIAMLNNDIDGAAQEFAKVHPEFMNINDYLYLMSFYQKNGMIEDMEILRNDFVAKPGGMYILKYPQIPDWSNYDEYKDNLVFSLIQTISHNQFIIYTDLSLTFLRFAKVISNDANLDAINYYLGQYYVYNSGDYKSCFDKIEESSPLYLFSQLKSAEKNKDMKTIEKIARKNPLFIPAVNLAVRENIRTGNRHAALKKINRGLRQKNLPDQGRVYFLKQRAYINLMFKKAKSAQKDMDKIKEIDGSLNPDIMLLQSRIWEQQNRNLDDAYKYAMGLIKMNSSDVNAWDVLGLIVNKTENIDNAIEILERVGDVATTSSLLYEHLGDLYMKKGNKDKAKRAYSQALDLSDDCLIVVPIVKQKLRKIK